MIDTTLTNKCCYLKDLGEARIYGTRFLYHKGTGKFRVNESSQINLKKHIISLKYASIE